MPPAKRGRIPIKQSSSQSGTVKLGLSVRESNPSSLIHFAKGFPNISHIDDSIGIANEMVPVRFRGKQLNLDTGRTLVSWEPSQKDSSFGQLTFTEGGKQITAPTFIKSIPLINGYNWLRYKERPNLPFFWLFQSEDTLQSCNQAYVDAVASFLANKAGKMVHSPHMCDFYGCFRGVSDTFFFNLEEDFEEFRFTHWFWEGLAKKEFGLRVIDKSTGYRFTTEEIIELFKPDTEFLNDNESDSDSDSEDSSSTDSNSLGAESCGSDFGNLEPSTPFGNVHDNLTQKVCLSQTMSTASSITTASESDSIQSFSEEYTIHAECYGMPIIAICLEQMDGTMDTLVEHTELSPIQTIEQSTQWLAWLFQVCVACTQLQSIVNLTHNDLHTDNVMFKRTTQEFLFYKDTSGTVWKVPTFGYIFTIIDYGRAIFTISGHTMISSDYDEEGDACGMYNFGPIQDDTQPRVHPNRSFDLCRLSCSLLRGLFPVNPKEKENGIILTKENGWDVRETIQPVFNLLWGWLKTKEGANCLETKSGEEKHPGFELYSNIAANVHAAVPRDQIPKPLFHPFVQKPGTPIPQSCSVIPI